MNGRDRTFLGFGFGPICSALFCYEAHRSGHFNRFVVAEVDGQLVDAVRRAGGRYTVNIAHADRIEHAGVEGVELLNPNEPADRAKLIDTVAEADELATALPSVRFYDTGASASVSSVLGEGLAKRDPGRPAMIYAAENHNRAAEILSGLLPPDAPAEVLNTVIGKMSGVIEEAAAIERLGLAPLTPDAARAVLVEAFNRILISRITQPGATRGIEVFIEKDDLLPFEEAKLYGHNAIHALIGYLAARRGLVTMDQAGRCDDLMATARAAFVDESGAAMCRKYAHLADDLFTPAGYRAYADDLLERMTNPYLNDRVDRVVRDPRRKCGYHDRLFGTMRLAVEQGVEPTHMAAGAAAACVCLHRGEPFADRAALAAALGALWGDEADPCADRLIDLTWRAMEEL